MFKIRSEQIRPFEPQAESAFVDRVMNYLRENHADAIVRLPRGGGEGGTVAVAALTDRVLREMVRGGIDRARDYGMSWKSALISFVVLMFIVAPNFDQDQRAENTLKNGGIPADERVDRLLDELTDEEWDEIAAPERYRAETWRMPIEAVEEPEIIEERMYERAS